MIRILLTFCLLVQAVSGFSGDETGVQWLSHLTANSQFRSNILLRNDDLDATLQAYLAFYDSDGAPAQVTFTANGGSAIIANHIILNLGAQTTQILSLTSVSGGDSRSLQARVHSFRDGLPSTLLSVEASFSRFEGNQKVAQVGVPVTTLAKLFKINLNTGIDSDSGQTELRGLGIVNTNEEIECTCVVTLLDEAGEAQATAMVIVPLRGKWLGVLSDLFPDATAQLGGGRGYLSSLCSEKVSVLALSFEGSLMSTVPVTTYQLP